MKRRDGIAYGLDKCRFTCTRDTRNTYTHRSTRMRQTLLDYGLRLRIMLGFIALDKGYGLREDCYVTSQNTVDIFVRSKFATVLTHEIGVYYRLIANTLRNVARAVVMRVGVL